MKSPFPGMDPYLEEHWGDIHSRLVLYAADQIQQKLPADLLCRVEERVFVASEPGISRSLYPDVRVVERPQIEPSLSSTSAVAVAEPLIVHLEDEMATETFLEIIDVFSGNKIVTILVVLSYSNKFPGSGQEKYLQKQQELKEARVNLVEIDLLRAGQRVQLLPENRIPLSWQTPYRVCVFRGWQSAKAEFYRISLREPLPAINVPLRPTDQDVALELQPLIEQCYRQGRYDDIDYKRNLEPPLGAEDAA